MERKNKIKKVLLILGIILVMIAAVLVSTQMSTTRGTANSEENIPSEISTTEETIEVEEAEVIVLEPTSLEHVDTEDKEELGHLLEESQARLAAAQSFVEACEILGYDSDNPVTVLAHTELENIQVLTAEYQEQYDAIIEAEKWSQREAEYPTATYVWRSLIDRGFNEYVVAGIVGNMMRETGGDTLNLEWNISSGTYYGLCQWNRAYSSVWGASLQGQIDYLCETMEYEFNTFGKCYGSGFNYQSFLNMQDAEDAALAFAKCYERCSSAGYGRRQHNADVALDYFCN